MTLTPIYADFFGAVDDFFSRLAAVGWGALLLGLICFGGFLTLRSRACFNVLRAAYPTETFQWRRIWGAYVAAYGFNNTVPARGGNLVRLFLTKGSVPNASYPAVASSFLVDNVFDLIVAVPILAFAFTQGVFPKPPDFSKLNAFDIAFLAAHPQFTLFLLTALALLVLIAFALLSVRVKAFWARVRQGLTILSDRRRYVREVVSLQATAWFFRFAAFWFLLEAFHVGGLGAQRAPGLCRGRGFLAHPIDAGWSGRAAGPARQGVRGGRVRRDRRRLLGRAADRDRRPQRIAGLRGAGLHLPRALVQGGHPARPGGQQRAAQAAAP